MKAVLASVALRAGIIPGASSLQADDALPAHHARPDTPRILLIYADRDLPNTERVLVGLDLRPPA